MSSASWSRCGELDCLRVADVAPSVDVRVRAGAIDVVGELPSMAGRIVRDGNDSCFVPRFAFVAGTTYTVIVDGQTIAALVRPRPDADATTEVVAIYPTAARVPRNLLRFYVHFSARMSEGGAADGIWLFGDDGNPMDGALLPTEHELWDGERRRLTVLLDPARIKRGLAGHRALGYPLREGESFGLMVSTGLRDARGVNLRAGAQRRYTARADARGRVDPHEWTITAPGAGGREPLIIDFGRSLDHALISRCLRLLGVDDEPVDGDVTVGFEERSWHFEPTRPWRRAIHVVAIDPTLEDVAGNSVQRVFDRDLSVARDDPNGAPTIRLPFAVD